MRFDMVNDCPDHFIVGGGGKHHAIAYLDHAALFDE